ncbi:MAG: hypothetical protein QG552_3657, partial [Thermodesulfobacteriota bacterium]|nr:hypothetical protein [Thermodesulfobacteriota bacterium]
LRRPGGVELRRLKLNTLREPFHTELQVVNALALPTVDMYPFDIYDLHCEAFQKERVTDEFYKVYKQVFEDVKQALEKTRSGSQAHAFTQMLMNRLMLLYFVQKRGWLDHNRGFLKDFYETYRQSETHGTSFYQDYLAPLFFGGFNREPGFENLSIPDSVRQIFTNAPYLNGGMFVRSHEIDAVDIHVPDVAFELMFDRLFERYNFTVREDTPLDIELAIDPELLGNVYQRIIGEEERGLSGLFYTQPTEVTFMCQRALMEYLARHIQGKRNEIIRLIMNCLDPPDDIDLPWDHVEQLLSNVKICDVACGSGAFLVAMLHLLVDLRTLVRKRLGQATDAFQLKKEIISKNLYGADVKAHAVRIAELRLWLSLVVDAPDDFVQKHPNEPLLPNLSYRLRQGDSLTEDFAGVPLHLRGEFDATSKRIPPVIGKIYDLEQKIFNGQVKSGDLAGIKSEHKRLERELFQGILKDRMESVRAQIRSHKRNLEKPRHIQQGLFGTEAEQLQLDFEKAFHKETESKIAALEQTYAEYGRLLESEDFGKLNERDYVLWEIDFAEVFMSKGGFDIIVGNPPYVRQEEIGPPAIVNRLTTPAERKAYKEKLIRAVQAFLGRDVRIDRKSDLYVYFYYLGMSLLNKEGVFVFLTSNSWLDVGYGAGLQEWLLHNMEVKDIYDNQAKRSFKSADVNTVIVVFNKPQGDSLSHTARFTAFKKPFEEVLSSDTLIAIDEAEGIVSTDDFRVYQTTQKYLLEEGLQRNKTLEGMDKTAALIGKYEGNKWGGKYLRAPDIYSTIMSKGNSLVTQLSLYFEGERYLNTGGADGFFILTKVTKEKDGFYHVLNDRVVAFGSPPFDGLLEEEYLVPLIKDYTKSDKHIEIQGYDAYCLVIKGQPSELAKKYIKWGEAQGYQLRSVTKNQHPWYKPTRQMLSGAEILVPRSFNDTFLIHSNPQRYLSLRFYRLHPKIEKYVEMMGFLNSTLVALFIETLGNKSLGQGVLDFFMADFLKMRIPLVKGRDLETAYMKIKDRPVQNVWKEFGSVPNDRKQLDDVVFDAIGLTQNERNAVYEAVIGLVEKRLSKAKSVKVG